MLSVVVFADLYLLNFTRDRLLGHCVWYLGISLGVRTLERVFPASEFSNPGIKLLAQVGHTSRIKSTNMFASLKNVSF